MRYPFVKQEGQMECGVACILMLIKYYNGYISTINFKFRKKTTSFETTFFILFKA
jgi:ABC-type bacteriocin/lantibiotic exporter with double-glycine peptidase domain